MFTNLKINTSLLICFVFIFRLLSVNANLLSSINTAQKSTLAHTGISHLIYKKRHSDEVSSSVNHKEYKIFEACEEDFEGETDLIKPNLPVILSYFDSIFTPVSVSSKTYQSFDAIKCELYPKKYLAISILRI